MNPTQSVAGHISGVDFGFLSANDIKALAVTRITNQYTFDGLLHPNAGGLYDPALGSFRNETCKTCNLRQSEGCPGHCGYIELPVPVYHPSFVDQLLRLIRAKCVFCHHFRSSRASVDRYICKLRLLKANLVLEAEKLDDEVERILHPNRAGQAEEEGKEKKHSSENIILVQREYTARILHIAMTDGQNLGTDDTEAVSTSKKTLVRNLMSELAHAKRCHVCEGESPAFRKERAFKFFMKAPSTKANNHNHSKGLSMDDPVLLLARRERQRARKLTSKMQSSRNVDEAVADLDTPSEAEGELDVDQSQDFLQEKSTDTFLNASFVHAAMTLLFEKESKLLRLLYAPRSSKSDRVSFSADMFFVTTLLVPPSRFRAENPGEDSITEHMRNGLYKKIIERSQNIVQLVNKINDPLVTVRQNSSLDTVQVELQDAVNALMDNTASRARAGVRQADGVKQVLEKKEGLFRQNMMGKRVDFAARSVISPDPNIETNEIGVPPVFAKKLTYPEPVTNHNYYELKHAVRNGEEVWPGAVAIETEDGQVIALKHKTPDERLAISNQLLAPSKGTLNGASGKKVHRHLNNGDIVIMNRQPTLHKPSMMCHRAKVLTGEKTIRMHYANCNTYNADFDGDEMNMHFPQNELARAEANLIADTNHQYLSATFGKPLRGLIQDHISVCVHLTSKDTFFTRDEYHEIVYAGIRPESGHSVYGTLLTAPPAIIKPPLWTGKQIITTILKNVTPKTRSGLTLTSKSQTNSKLWGKFEDEQQVIFKDGELLSGILDKKQIGPAPGGFVHAIYESLGHVAAGRVLSILGRMLTRFLNKRAFSCGVQDIVLTPHGNEERLRVLEGAKKVGLEVAAKYVTLGEREVKADDPELLRRLEEVLRDDEKQKGLDDLTKGRGGDLSSEITKTCLPSGLVKSFPSNQMQAMTQSGAKGSAVNANLISCNLGQQVLEGRRVPSMVSGKTLPAFDPFDSAIRAGGYIRDRFLTGVKTPEYYFHAMAGREGLIDTAVKTARSGYLQRCLVKGMESLKVDYDTSVRDSADGSVIQFLYGEDGLDVCKQVYLKQFKFTTDNIVSLVDSYNFTDVYPKIECKDAAEYNKKAVKGLTKGKSMDPALSKWNPNTHAGSMSEKMYRAVRKYMDENPDKSLTDKKNNIKGVAKKRVFESLVELQYLKAVVEPGEAVGIVAAQSIGEPSTQMTLNTFHLAGHSSKNVTLGIPRLREIVMTASAKIGTPMMTLHLQPDTEPEVAENLAKQFSRLTLAEIVDSCSVTQRVGTGKSHSYAKSYIIRFEFYDALEYCEEHQIDVSSVMRTVAQRFLPTLNSKLEKELKKRGVKTGSKDDGEDPDTPEIGKATGRVTEHMARRREDGNDSGDDTDVEENADPDDVDADVAKERGKRADHEDWEEPDEEEKEIASQVSDAESDDEEEPQKPTRPADETRDDSEDEGEPFELSEEAKLKAKRAWLKESPSEVMQLVNQAKANRKVVDFEFDRNGKWCEATIEHPADYPKILMLQFVEDCARSTVIHAVPGLKACFVDKDNKYADPTTGEEQKEPAIITEGCNLGAIVQHQDVLDVNRAFTNDIAAMLKLYGVEAGRACIVREMHAVFEGHSIDVDLRHLNLIGDYMTRSGGFAPFSRHGMKNAVSAFMKMSFETTVGVLKEAVAGQEMELLRTPSARLVVGALSNVGTGSFDLYVQPPPPQADDADEGRKSGSEAGSEMDETLG